MKTLPKIGITMRLEAKTRRFYLGRDYSEALESLGAIPIHIALIPNKTSLKALLSELDGIMLPGSDNDLDPLLYGEEPLPKLGRVEPLKDQTDLLILSLAEKMNLPVLGVCYGMQAINVSRGGSLIQDIGSQIDEPVKHSQGEPLSRNSHSLECESESVISRLITNKAVNVNSHHHQSVKKAGKNLKVTAKAKDGIVECIEDTREDRFVLGVQWHPELSWKSDELSSAIFKRFVSESRNFRNNRSNK